MARRRSALAVFWSGTRDVISIVHSSHIEIFRAMIAAMRRLSIMKILPAALLLLAVLASLPMAFAQPPASHINPAAQLSTAQIVGQIERHNRLRNERLEFYRSIRHYQVEYKGLSHVVAAMEVEASYDARSGKSFRVLSQSGSRGLCDKVLRRALEGEQEAAKSPASTALTSVNYTFTLVGEEPVAGRAAYVLEVEPRSGSKFLYRGRIWVDAAEFAVVRISARPAQNPSFWISRTEIEQQFAPQGEFWLPRHNRSETHVRIGGAAVFTIDYGDYQIRSTDQPAAETVEGQIPHASRDSR
jgi:hypothetical protein